MAKGKKTGGRAYTSGPDNPGYLGGRPRMSPASRVIKGKNRLEIQKLLANYLNFDIQDLQAIVRDVNKTVVEHWVARIAIEGVKGGDTSRLNFMIEQIYGKLKETKVIELPKPTIIERLDGSQTVLGAEMSNAEGEDEDE